LKKERKSKNRRIKVGMFYNEKEDEPRYGIIAIAVIAAFLIIIAVSMYVFPQYGVWQKELSGKAQLKEAEWNRQIAIQEAQATKESAKMLADAEIIRAEGIAEANRIISNSITTEYIKYKFVEGLNDGNTEVIYVPTEANLPILEATRRA
jgi:predicted Holliday junction resolvase-like endonuclease